MQLNLEIHHLKESHLFDYITQSTRSRSSSRLILLGLVGIVRETIHYGDQSVHE